MKLRYCLVAVCASALTLAGVQLSTRPRLENERVKATEVVYAPGGVRPRGVRQADQVIVFLDDCKYERTDPKTGEKTVRTRQSGDVIWHSKGEDAPQLVNIGPTPYRTLVIELK